MAQAARVGDLTAHGSPGAPGVGSPNVLIGGQPAWRAQLDSHACPAPGVPHGVEISLLGSTTVFINNRMASRVGDILQGGGPPNTFAVGAPTVVIGDVGFGMGKPSRRLAFAKEMKELLKDWNMLDRNGRIEAIRRALNRATPPAMPPLGVVVRNMPDPHRLGEMEFHDWRVALNATLVDGSMTDAKMAKLTNTVYHEGRHGQQWFHVAQSQAAAGVSPSQISNAMDIPRPIAETAAMNPADRGTSEGEVGKAVDTSVYGSRAAYRNDVLTDLAQPHRKHGTYEQYRALPEEEDAWRQGNAAEADYTGLPTAP
jgi:uncharacterized Zn-binding protein involved in type VI secretion